MNTGPPPKRSDFCAQNKRRRVWAFPAAFLVTRTSLVRMCAIRLQPPPAGLLSSRTERSGSINRPARTSSTARFGDLTPLRKNLDFCRPGARLRPGFRETAKALRKWGAPCSRASRGHAAPDSGRCWICWPRIRLAAFRAGGYGWLDRIPAFDTKVLSPAPKHNRTPPREAQQHGRRRINQHIERHPDRLWHQWDAAGKPQGAWRRLEFDPARPECRVWNTVPLSDRPTHAAERKASAADVRVNRSRARSAGSVL